MRGRDEVHSALMDNVQSKLIGCLRFWGLAFAS